MCQAWYWRTSPLNSVARDLRTKPTCLDTKGPSLPSLFCFGVWGHGGNWNPTWLSIFSPKFYTDSIFVVIKVKYRVFANNNNKTDSRERYKEKVRNIIQAQIYEFQGFSLSKFLLHIHTHFSPKDGAFYIHCFATLKICFDLKMNPGQISTCLHLKGYQTRSGNLFLRHSIPFVLQHPSGALWCCTATFSGHKEWETSPSSKQSRLGTFTCPAS